MEIVVCVKQVPDTAARIKIDAAGRGIEKEGLTYVVNPYDEFAIEEALRIKEKHPDVTVTLVTVGPKKAEEALRTGLAMGADRALHVLDPALDDSDPGAIALLLHAAIRDLHPDLIFCGWKAVDDDSALVGPALAELLDLPQATFVTQLELDLERRAARVHREIEGAAEVLELPLPALLTAQKGLNEPRYPSLPGIMKAKKKEVKVLALKDLGLSADVVGPRGSRTELLQMFPPPPRKAGQVLQGPAAETVKTLVRLLHEEAKVI
ncbi:MAG: electron transfer flavoprotein subunit beta/FixA family protein [Deltaproteobacteria bacterium]|nr:electron transfer flavoprotein subunit beta/FixA family protein [Deltaproteobacteria bacterium]